MTTTEKNIISTESLANLVAESVQATTTTESVIVEAIAVQAKPEKKAKTAKKPKVVVSLPNVGDVMLANDKEYTFTEFAESEESEMFAVLYPFKNKNCLVVPVQAFYEEYESVEYVSEKKTGKTYHYLPNAKNQSIEITVKHNERKCKPITVCYKKA